ncbi:tetratricopeptide repeat protein [Litoribacter populi]|uniref:tetratricopeptide repeat protein n=1 Tax=Litoribacter populi TaxID=2598460 RepID=UPI00163D7494|nr:tetratricopeptide repeat protein [Litoribacter populi]
MKKATFLTVMGGAIVLSACTNVQSVIKRSADQQLQVQPNPLVLEGDSVKFDMEAQLPPKMLNKNFKYTLQPEFQYQGKIQPISDNMEFDGAEINNKEQNAQQKSFAFPYKDGMETGTLKVEGRATHKKKGGSASTEGVRVAEGIITTSRLARIGQVTEEGGIPNMGLYMGHDYEAADELEPTEVEFFFQQGSANLRSSEVNSDRGSYLKAFIADNNVTKTVTITGTHSPEGSERVNRNLSKNRAEAIERFYRREMEKFDYRDESKDVQFILKPVVDDWSDFKLLLEDYNQLNESQKEEYYEIIDGSGDFDSKERQMRQLSTYKTVFNDLYPRMRIAQTEILTTKDKKSEAEISILGSRISRGDVQTDTLSEAELAYAAEINPSYSAKESLYKAQVETYDSPMSHNNLGVVYLNLANRSASKSEKDEYLRNAIREFEAANADEEKAYAMHNLGQAHLMLGDYETAYKYMSDASTKDQSEEFTHINDATRGAVDIINGDYKLATIRLNNAPENETNLFNKGLAYLLTEDYRNAVNAFEESVMVNRDFGYGFYGLAIVAARSGNEEVMYENLQKASERSSDLKRRAATDPEFRAYRDNSSFREAIR